MAATTIGKIKERIREKLSILTVRVKLETAVGHTDINHEAEDFYCGLLNTAFGWNLTNLNELQMNFPAIDLADRENRIAVQVTSTEGRKKVQDTLDRFFEKKLDRDYDRLIVLIIGEKPNYRGAFALEGELDFDKNRDIWDTAVLTQRIDSLPQNQLNLIDAYLDAQLPQQKQHIVTHDSPEMIAALTGIQKAVETMASSSKSQVPKEQTSVHKTGMRGKNILVFTCALVLFLGGIILWWFHNHRRYHDGMLMRNSFENIESEQEEPAFHTQAKRKEVATITFLNYVDPEVENTVDASALQNGSVRAWAVPNGNLYDLYIAADGGVFASEDSSSLFREMINLTTIRFNDAFDTSRAENMGSMFQNCTSLKKLDLSSFRTENVTNMANMFYGCRSLSALDLSGFDTRNVTDMYAMFYQLTNLSELDVSSFDTENVENMGYLFSNCTRLAQLNLANFNTSAARNMEHMFSSLESLTHLDLSNFDTSNVERMYAMFYRCMSLIELDLSSFDTGKVTDMAHMFQDCGSLFSLDINHFDTSAVTTMKCMFNNCDDLFSLRIDNINTENVTDMSFMFNGCSGLSKLTLGAWETSKVTSMRKMFSGCLITELDLSSFNTSHVVDMSGMFDACAYLMELDLSNFDTSRVTDMSRMFHMCVCLSELNLDSFHTENVVNMSKMFSYCWEIKSLDLSGFDTSNVTDMSSMFESCISLQNLKISGWNFSSVMLYDNFMDEGKTVDGYPWQELFS